MDVVDLVVVMYVMYDVVLFLGIDGSVLCVDVFLLLEVL